MTSQLKILQSEHSKGKSADKDGGATQELQYLMNFMAKTIEHLPDFAFVSMYNVTHDKIHLAHMKSGIKQDTLAALRQAPMDLPTLFPNSILKKAEDISKFEDKGHSLASSSGRKDTRYHPYKRLDRSSFDSKGLESQRGKVLVRHIRKRAGSRPESIHHVRPRASLLINDNQCEKNLL